MYLDWTRHLKDDKEKTRFQNQVIAAKPVLERLMSLIDEKEAALNRSEFDPKSFDSPSWAYHQAFKNGVRATNYGLRKLIDLDNQIIKEK